MNRLFLGLIKFGEAQGWEVSVLSMRNFSKSILASLDKPDAIICYQDCWPVLSKHFDKVPYRLHYQVDETKHEPYVAFDDEACGRLAAEHLVKCGYKNFAFIGRRHGGAALLRYQSYKQRLSELGYSLSTFSESGSLSQWHEEDRLNRRAVIKWLKSLPKPTGIFIHNDASAIGLVSMCRAGGLRIPDDCALLGAGDETEYCSIMEPSLSSVRMPYRRLGYELAESLHGWVETGQAPASRLIRPETVTQRESTRILAADDPAFASIFKYIQHNLDADLTVNTLAARAGMTRRAFEIRFTEVTGTSPGKGILQLRLSQAATLIRETRLSFIDIAQQCGFSSQFHLSNTFQKHYGCRPSEYRTAEKKASLRDDSSDLYLSLAT